MAVKERVHKTESRKGVRTPLNERRKAVALEAERIIRRISEHASSEELSIVQATLSELDRAIPSKEVTEGDLARRKREEILNHLRGGVTYTSEEVAELERANIRLVLEARRSLLEGAWNVSQVAEVLGGKSRQTPHDWLRAGKLLAFKDGGKMKFPSWQFDAHSPNGVFAGLPEVLKCLGSYAPLTDRQKASFLMNSQPSLGGKTPIELLRSGKLDEVLIVARGVGVM